MWLHRWVFRGLLRVMLNGLRYLSGIDRTTGKVIRRYEQVEPSVLIHIGYQKK